ncbi:MAG: hypothetical protein U9P10_03155 [Thermodesulfobacteriota bacterium]|nr:hypothetical protein [Thermodesulfobacteriota bacterium]
MATVGYTSAGQAEDAKRYMEMLKSERIKTRIDSAKYITRSGLIDPLLFETIKNKLLTGYIHNQTNPKHMDEMAWYCKALASSGNMAYSDTLREVARTTANEKLKRHCLNSIDQISVHAKRNKIIKAGFAKDNSLSSEENKMIAMFRSKDPLMMRDAAKITSRNPFPGEAVTDVISEELLKLYNQNSGNKIMIDALSWMCKALGASGNPKYKETLNQVIQTGKSNKLKKYAKKSIRML